MATLQADPGSPTAGRLAHLLKSYTSSHPLRSPSPLPAGSRFDPRVPQRSAPPSSASPLLWTLSTWLAFAQFLLVKGLYIVWSLLKHFLFGPQRKSWGYRMTFVSETDAHEHAACLPLLSLAIMLRAHRLHPPSIAVLDLCSRDTDHFVHA